MLRHIRRDKCEHEKYSVELVDYYYLDVQIILNDRIEHSFYNKHAELTIHARACRIRRTFIL